MSAAYRAYKTTATSTKTVDQRSTFAYLGSMTLLHVTGLGVQTVLIVEGRKKTRCGPRFARLGLPV